MMTKKSSIPKRLDPLVKNGSPRATRSVIVKIMYGVYLNIHEAVGEIVSSFPKSFIKSLYGWNIEAPFLFCIYALIFLITPIQSGDIKGTYKNLISKINISICLKL